MGTIRNRGSKFQAIVRMGGHQPLYETFETRREAASWIRKTELELESKVVTSPKLLISDLIDKYVKEIAPRRKMADSHLAHDIPSIRRAFADMRMENLMGKGLQQWVLRQGTAPSTRYWHIARLFGVLRQVESHWDVSIPWDDMHRSKDRLFELGYLALPNERDRRVTPEEFDRITAAISRFVRIPARELFSFALASAMRIGEICRITWTDFDEKSRTVIVRDRKHPRRKFGNHQEVPLLNGAFEIAARQPRGDDRIFPCDPLVASRVFKDCAARAGVQNVVLHDLRHEGISRLFELGFEIQEVALVSGHTNWRTLRRYTHLRPASLVEKERRLRLLAA